VLLGLVIVLYPGLLGPYRGRTVLGGSTTYLMLLEQAAASGADLSSLRTLAAGGSTIAPELADRTEDADQLFGALALRAVLANPSRPVRRLGSGPGGRTTRHMNTTVVAYSYWSR
jgi:hypothetical protein